MQKDKSLYMRVPMSGIMRSVSIFVTRTRRVSNTSKMSVNEIQNYNNNAPKEGVEMTVLDPQVGNKEKSRSNKNYNNISTLMDSVKKQTHFTKDEIEKLCNYYKKLLSNGSDLFRDNLHGANRTPNDEEWIAKGIDRNIFRELLHNTFHILTEEILMDRIFCAFDKRSDSVINLDEWLIGLSTFLKGRLQEKITFAFFVYDLNSDGFITKEEIFALLRNSLIKFPQDEDPDESVRDLTEVALRKLDCDGDNKISFEDFKQAVTNDKLLLEALGQCLPSENVAKQFLANLSFKNK